MTNSGDALPGGNMKFLMALTAALAVAGIFYMVFGQTGTPSKDESSQISELSDNVMGKADAPVTIIEYSSMTCPHCAVFHTDTLPGLRPRLTG